MLIKDSICVTFEFQPLNREAPLTGACLGPISQLTFTCLKSIIETLEDGVKYFES